MPLQSPLRIYGIKNCTTMKKAFAALEASGVAWEFVDYKKAGIAASHLPDWIARAGWEALLNRRGLTWKRLPEADRSDVDANTAARLMAEHPTLIKRPVLDTGEALIIGFDPDRYAELPQ